MLVRRVEIYTPPNYEPRVEVVIESFELTFTWGNKEHTKLLLVSNCGGRAPDNIYIRACQIARDRLKQEERKNDDGQKTK